jgi:hypothetical protein
MIMLVGSGLPLFGQWWDYPTYSDSLTTRTVEAGVTPPQEIARVIIGLDPSMGSGLSLGVHLTYTISENLFLGSSSDSLYWELRKWYVWAGMYIVKTHGVIPIGENSEIDIAYCDVSGDKVLWYDAGNYYEINIKRTFHECLEDSLQHFKQKFRFNTKRVAADCYVPDSATYIFEGAEIFVVNHPDCGPLNTVTGDFFGYIVFPNPFTDHITVSAPPGATVTVTDLTGKLVCSAPAGEIQTGTWPVGMYIATISCEGESPTIRRIVKTE